MPQPPGRPRPPLPAGRGRVRAGVRLESAWGLSAVGLEAGRDPGPSEVDLRSETARLGSLGADEQQLYKALPTAGGAVVDVEAAASPLSSASG